MNTSSEQTLTLKLISQHKILLKDITQFCTLVLDSVQLKLKATTWQCSGVGDSGTASPISKVYGEDKKADDVKLQQQF